MAEVIKRKKPLSVMPLKSSQPMGASLAFMGINRSIPMMHGSQGCTAFAKVFFVRHFREPIPLQTTAMDQVSSVMGSEPSVIEGLDTICKKSAPALIGVPTTGLSETQGADVQRAVKEFRLAHPEHDHIKVVPVNVPDYAGTLESGFAMAVEAMIDVLVPEAEAAGTQPGRRRRQVNVLASSMLTPGDLDEIKMMIEAFGLRPVVVPDISESLDGTLADTEFTPLSTGGTPVSEFATLGDACATLVIGESLARAARLLKKRTGVPDHHFPSLIGLEAVDTFVQALHEISGEAVPARLERQRNRLRDAMVDTHFMTGFARVAIAADPDLLYGFSDLVKGMGGEVVAAVAPARAPILDWLEVDEVQVGDLQDLENRARDGRADLLIGNSHAVVTAERLGIPLLRAGFPQYDLIGGFARTWVGYHGTRQVLFDLANLQLSRNHGEIEPYRSPLAQKPEYRQEEGRDDRAAAHAGG